MKASLLSQGVQSSILGSRMVFGNNPRFYDYETLSNHFWDSNLGLILAVGRRKDQLAILVFLMKKWGHQTVHWAPPHGTE